MGGKLQEEVKILSNQKVGKSYFLLRVASRKISAFASPGQFVQIKVAGDNEILLRRPFGVHRVGKNTFDCLFEVVGPGTKLLSEKQPRDSLDIIGPLGNGFNYTLYAKRYTLILVAGGMGVAPLVFLAEKLTEGKAQSARSKVIVLMGAKTESQILCVKEFKKLGCMVKVATDDGSKGFKGKITDLLKVFLRTSKLTNQQTFEPTIYACGPRPMLKVISRLSIRYNIPAEISLEEHLACGIGACFGCAVKTKDGFKRVCKEGPVFPAEVIAWDQGGQG